MEAEPVRSDVEAEDVVEAAWTEEWEEAVAAVVAAAVAAVAMEAGIRAVT